MSGALAERQRDRTLSWGERSLWFVQRLSPGATAYNLALAAEAHDLVPEALAAAWQRLADHHPALRTTYPAPAGTPVARVWERLPVDVRTVEAADLVEAAALLAREADLPFDLANGPVVRLRIVRLPGGSHAVLFAMHHIGVDFASLALLLEELGIAYAALAAGSEPRLPPPTAVYADFVAWQERYLAGPEGDRSLAAWQARLAGSPPALDLPMDRPRPPVQSFRGGIHRVTIEPETAAALRALGAAGGTSTGTVLFAAFASLVHRYTGLNDLPIGCPVAGRFRDVVGYFVNSVVVRADLAGCHTFRELVGRLRERTAEAREHGDYPFPLLVEKLRLPRDPSRPPLFQLFFAFYAGEEERALRLLAAGAGTVRLGGLALAPLPLARGASMFDLSLFCADAGEAIDVTFQYCADLFADAAVDRLAADFRDLLTAVAADPERPISSLPASLGAAVRTAEPAATATASGIASSRDRAEARRAHMDRQKQLRGRT